MNIKTFSNMGLSGSTLSAPATAGPTSAEPSLLRLERMWLAHLQGSWRQFERAAANPTAHQVELLRRILERNAESQYGHAHGFSRIDSLAAYQAYVPMVDYDALAPWVEQIAEGSRGVLTSERTIALTQSAGMSGAPKWLPVTHGLIDEMGNAVRPFLYDLFRALPELMRHKIYVQLPPPAPLPERRRGGIAYASTDLTRFTGIAARWAMDKMLAVPTVVSRFTNVDDWWRLTRQHLLGAENLGLMIVANPGFLLNLMHTLEEDLADLLPLLPTPRADAIRAGLDTHGRLNAAALWPHLQMVCSWRDGPASVFLPALQRYFPGIKLYTRPMACKEGVLSVPLLNQPGAALAVDSHVYEFIDANEPRLPPVLADGVRVDHTYLPVVTTSGGLYRYNLKEAVRCVGHFANTPLLEYVDKAEPTVDMCGEALTAHRVQSALDEVAARLGFTYRFAMAAPRRDVLGYCLYVESDASYLLLKEAVKLLDEALCRSYTYWQCRRASGLRSMRIARIRNGWRTFESVLTELGVPRHALRPTALDARCVWDNVFEAA